MNRSTKSYEERLLEMERREQKSLEKQRSMQHKNGNYRNDRKPTRVESVHTDFA